MGWRFRKSFKVFPGVRLNLSRHGVSATLGAAPFGLNVGPRGVYSNVSVPGTGLYARQRLDSADRAPTVPIPASPVGSEPAIPLPQGTETQSASTELLGSQALAGLKGLLTEAYEEQEQLRREIAVAEGDHATAAQHHSRWYYGRVFKHLFRKAFAARQAAYEMATAKLEELRDQLRQTALATQIEIAPEQAEPFYKMRDAFAALSECQRVWDTLERHPVNRVVTRSAASESISREPVSFSLGQCDLLQWEQNVPHLPNRQGGDLYLYPGFVLYRASRQAFALIDLKEVGLAFRPVQFIEGEALPTDTQVVAKAWAKSNKDGSPDRRFQNNHQLPVALYGALTFTSPSGLHEEYLVSSAERAVQFWARWNAFTAALGARTA